jgi:hypothetical protein
LLLSVGGGFNPDSITDSTTLAKQE